VIPSVVSPIGREKTSRIKRRPMPIPSFPRALARPRARHAPESPTRPPHLPAATAPYHGARVALTTPPAPNRRAIPSRRVRCATATIALHRGSTPPPTRGGELQARPARPHVVAGKSLGTGRPLAVTTTGFRLTQAVKISSPRSRARTRTHARRRRHTTSRTTHADPRGQSQATSPHTTPAAPHRPTPLRSTNQRPGFLIIQPQPNHSARFPPRISKSTNTTARAAAVTTWD
jgi:hypothetical protein